MLKSIERIAKNAKDTLKSAEFYSSNPNTDAQAFKDEAQLIRDAGGLNSGKLYNQINSPGESMLPPL